MVTYEFTDISKAYMFHSEALQYGSATMHIVIGWYPDTWQVHVSPEFDAIVEARRAA